MFRNIMITDKTYVGYKYTNFVTSSGIFHLKITGLLETSSLIFKNYGSE